MQAVIMVAGKSTRTYPLTLSRPKPLLTMANRPLIHHSLDQLTGLFDEVILIVGYRKEMIQERLGDNYRGMRIIYQEQKEQLGTGHAVLQARPHIRDKFVAMNGDDLFARADFEQLIRYDYAALVKKVSDPSLYGVYQVDSSNRVLDLVEKPKQYLGDLANIGCYIFKKEFFDELEKTPKSERNEIEITSAIQSVALKTEFYAIPIKGFWLPTGYAWDLLGHQEFLMAGMESGEILGTVEAGATLKGSVSVGKNTLIKSGAYIEGPVVIGENCIIGPNCYIRQYTSIGNNCRIGNAVEIKNSVIMDDCNICHLSYVGDSVLGQGCNLGAGTITANHRHNDKVIRSRIKNKLVDSGRTKFGAILSDGVQTGVHTSIYPGRKLWPGVMTRPGAVVDKDLMPESAQWD
jgi:UDP-N-acetylglucosamine diphosphorylase / glucose-1-phosphate thymidylyltransferase / UDP-N-acetylgalactosamine diphosphorylase / glucosamine-1-phosphate N-acetyltransferase / galactosamine-1-phosphate N-acetyltransferase